MKKTIFLVLLGLSGCAMNNNSAQFTQSDNVSVNYPINVYKSTRLIGINTINNHIETSPDIFSKIAVDYLQRGSGKIIISGQISTIRKIKYMLYLDGLNDNDMILVADSSHKIINHDSISYSVFQDKTKKCADFSNDEFTESQNKPFSGFGCFYQHDVAAMVANPRDLVQHRGNNEVESNPYQSTGQINFNNTFIPPKSPTISSSSSSSGSGSSGGSSSSSAGGAP